LFFLLFPESIPTDDPTYDKFKALQDSGATFSEEIALLQATGQFGGRSWKDWSDDTLNAHGQAVQVVGASKDTALGLTGGAAAYAGMLVSSPACVGVVTCALPVGLGALGTTSMVGAWNSASQITAGFRSGEPENEEKGTEDKGTDLFKLELKSILNKSVPFCLSPFVRMPPALLVNYGALYDKYRPAIESEKKREN